MRYASPLLRYASPLIELRLTPIELRLTPIELGLTPIELRLTQLNLRKGSLVKKCSKKRHEKPENPASFGASYNRFQGGLDLSRKEIHVVEGE